MLVKIRGKVFGSLKAGEIIIHIGYGYAINNGGGLRPFQTTDIPKECRFPNTYVWITMQNGDLLKIEKMSQHEIKENNAI